MMRKILVLFLAVTLLVTGCTKEEETETTLEENQYYLLAADMQKILITLPEDFEAAEQDTEVSILKSYYKSNSTELLSLHYFEETDQYSVADIKESFADYVSQYEDLVSGNDGELEDKTDVTDFSAGGMDGQYVEVTYSLGNSVSYCAEFYVKEDSHVLHGTLRLDGEDKEEYGIKELADKLLNQE